MRSDNAAYVPKVPAKSGEEMKTDEQRSAPQRSLRKLYKSSSERIVDGVCGGIAKYLGVDASAVRLLLLAFTIFSIAAGVIFYIVAMIVMPPDPDFFGTVRTAPPSQGEGKVSNASATATLIVGIIVVIIGVTLLFDYYGVFSVTSLWHSFGKLALPVVLILIGGALLLGREQSELESSAQVPQSGLSNGENPGPHLGVSHESDFHISADGRKLTRSAYDKKIAGVCGGLAEYLNIDSTIVRLIYILLTLASFGLALILYVVSVFVIPKGTRL